MPADKAYATAEAEWKQQHPGMPIGKDVKDKILGRVLQLMQGR
jgi:hypothetical protein